MKNKISYSDGPMEEVKVVEDFLPPPEELAFREETVKVTIALSKANVEFWFIGNTRGVPICGDEVE
jgi:hypothetical protein